MAEAILVATPGMMQKTLWWQSVVNFFMLEPLLHLPRIKNDVSEVGNQQERSGTKRQMLKQELKGSKYWFPSWFIYIPW